MCHISQKNEKMGEIPSVSLPSWLTCPLDLPCRAACYAHRMEQYRLKMRDNNMDNFDLYKRNPVFYEEFIVETCALHRYFRWHVDGDMPDYNYLLMVVRIAERSPETRFWLPTKRYQWVNHWLDENGGEFSKNLCVILSFWGTEFMPDNPYDLPTAHVRFADPAKNVAIPEKHFDCLFDKSKIQCKRCRKCWHAQRGEAIVYEEKK